MSDDAQVVPLESSHGGSLSCEPPFVSPFRSSSKYLTNQVANRSMWAPSSCFVSITTPWEWTADDGAAETARPSGAPGGRQAHLVVVVGPFPHIRWQPGPLGRYRPRSERPFRRLRHPAALAVWPVRGRLRVPIHTPARRSGAAMPLEFFPVLDLRGSERRDDSGARLRRTVRVVNLEAVSADGERVVASGRMVSRAAYSPRPAVLLVCRDQSESPWTRRRGDPLVGAGIPGGTQLGTDFGTDA